MNILKEKSREEVNEELREELLLKYIQGECSNEEEEEISNWLAASPKNRDILFGLEMAYNLPQKARFAEPKRVAKAEKRLMTRIESEKRRKRRATILTWSSSIAAAAVLVVVMWNVFGVKAFGEEMITVSVPKGGAVKQLVLPDGTKVSLNESSTLTYSKSYSDKKRSVYLDGEAYFDVVSDPSSPFTANSQAITTTVLGTQFNMKSFADSDIAEATLLTGEIMIKGNNDEGQIVLAPGQKAEVDVRSKRMTVREVNAPIDAVWRNNLIPFNDATIKEITDALASLYGAKFMVDDSININNKYTGVIPRKESLEDVLELITNAIPISYTISDNTVHVSNAAKRQ